MIPTRYAIMLVSFGGFSLTFIFRANMSVALVKMVNSSHHSSASNYTENFHINEEQNRSSNFYDSGGEFDWNEKQQGVVLTAILSLYGLGGLCGGRLAERLGCKKVMGFCICIMSVLTLLTPLSGKIHIYALVAVRLVQGLLTGMSMPSMNTVISRWMPKTERSIAVSIFMGATRFGNVLGHLITGYLCKSSLLNGWPLTFYVFGSLGVLWTIAWAYIMYETPREHPRISVKELEYICKSQGKEKAKKSGKVPYKAIFTSVPVWANVFANIGESWGTMTLPVTLPLYFAHILQCEVEVSGLLASIPSLLQTAFMFISGLLADYLIRSDRFNKTVIRKIMNTIGHIIPAACLVGVTLVGYNKTANVVLITIALGINGFVAAGFRTSLIDMTPDFSATIMGLSVFVASNIAFLSPLSVGLLTNDNQTLRQWHIVFWINAAFYALAGFWFLFGGSSDLQPWGLAKEQKQEIDGKSAPEHELEMT